MSSAKLTPIELVWAQLHDGVDESGGADSSAIRPFIVACSVYALAFVSIISIRVSFVVLFIALTYGLRRT
jgi:hypothetical protein